MSQSDTVFRSNFDDFQMVYVLLYACSFAVQMVILAQIKILRMIVQIKTSHIS